MTPLLLNEIHLRICQESIPRIEKCLKLLDKEQVNYRPNDSSNSIANLVLHLEGNCRQWLLNNLFAVPYQRNRVFEFDAREVEPAVLKDKLKTLKQDVLHACRIGDIKDLEQIIEIQGISTTVFGAAVHAIEHFSYHTGQIALFTKLLKNQDLGFYAGFEKLNG